MARRQPEGRYEVGERAVPSVGAAFAYALSLAMRERRTVYVREIGVQQALARAEYDEQRHAASLVLT